MGRGRARMLIVGAGVAAPLLLGISPAMADNPNYFTTPAAGPSSPNADNPPTEVCTYQAPPAQDGAAPGSSAAGGSPGFVFNECHETGVE
jgi:hypothetical protein